jgi:peptidoglycan LD-endopeptidase LytH
MKLKNATIVMVGTVLVLGGCASGESFDTRSRGRPTPTGTTRDAIVRELEERARRGPVDPATLREEAARRALSSGAAIAPSFRERVRFPADQPHVVAYRFTIRQGQTLDVALESLEGEHRLEAELFQALSGQIHRPIDIGGPSATWFSFAAPATGEYVLRLRPEPGTGGLYDVRVDGAGPLLFPVADVDLGAVGSWFGDARDGGARGHEGIDIFAPRGTPVVAVVSGRVHQARNTPVGGKIIWLEDLSSDLTFYYAHLDEYYVREGAFVNAGDTIGSVGNTGNARGVRPHLHFGVYRPNRYALDPVPMLSSPSVLVEADVDPSMLGRWARVRGDRVRLRNSPSLGGAVVAELTPSTPFLVLGGIADWHRVVLPDGTTGFVSARLTEADDER